VTTSLFDISADLDTPVSAYLKLKPFRPRFLLESVEGGERLARYSFIGFGDSLEYRLEARRRAPAAAGDPGRAARLAAARAGGSSAPRGR
jgi:anthranilate synthase component I